MVGHPIAVSFENSLSGSIAEISSSSSSPKRVHPPNQYLPESQRPEPSCTPSPPPTNQHTHPVAANHPAPPPKPQRQSPAEAQAYRAPSLPPAGTRRSTHQLDHIVAGELQTRLKPVGTCRHHRQQRRQRGYQMVGVDRRPQ